MTDTAPQTALERATEFFTKSAIIHKSVAAKVAVVTEELTALQNQLGEAADELTWAQNHPALAGADFAALYAQAGEDKGETKPETAEAPKKRTRRSKEQIAADKAAEEAAKAASVEPTKADEPEPVEAPTPVEPEAVVENNTVSDEPQGVFVPEPEPTPVPAPAAPPAAAPAALPAGDFNPFGPKAG